MKYLICTVLCLFISSVVHAGQTVDDVEELGQIDHFEWAQNGTACILADFDATFTLNVTYEGKMHTKPFSLPKVANFTVTGACANGTSQASLVLSTDAYDLAFTITVEKDEVKADLQYVLTKPAMMFPGINYTDSIAMTGTGDEFPDMGKANTSYLCNSAEMLTLNSDQQNVTATIEIIFTNFKFQAYNVDKTYSKDVTECAGDATSSTAGPTTSLPPPVGRGNYTLKDDKGEICLRLMANITLEVTYGSAGNMTSRTVRVPSNAEVNGSCHATNSVMTLTFTDDEVSEMEAQTEGNVTFQFIAMEDFAFIETVDVNLVFMNETNTTVHVEKKVHDVLASSSEFYSCDEEELFLGGDDRMILQELQIQAFGLDKGAFSKDGVDCKVIPKEPTDSNYTVQNGNVTCISMTGALQLVIPYAKTTGPNGTATINFVRDQPPVGSCGNMSETMTIMFRKNEFSIKFDFAKDTSSLSATAGDAFEYFVQNLTVTYTKNEEFFPGAKTADEVVTVTDSMQTLYKTSGNMYYKCETDQTVNLPGGVNLNTKDFKFVAFHTSPTPPDLNNDSANECAADTETNSIVPIAVGAALAGLVVIVLIAYLIGRRRSHKGYESV